LRRAVAGEQLFFALSRRRPAGGRRCVALVDAGPEQLGNCRLAQLALLMVLAERARAAGAQFLWSSWQATPGDLDEGFEGGALRRFLEQRSPRRVAPEMKEAWLALLGSPAGEEERWSIGGAGAGQGGGLQWVAIGESDAEIACRSLIVEWRPSGRPRKSLELPLPPEAARIGLLADPYAERQAKPKQPKTNLEPKLEGPIESALFGFRSSRLIFRCGSEVVSMWCPSDFQRPLEKADFYRLRENEQLVAAGNSDRQNLLIVLRKDERTFFHRLSRGQRRDKRPAAVDGVPVAPFPPGAGCGLCLPYKVDDRWFFLDAAHRVHVFDFQKDAFEAGIEDAAALFCADLGIHVLSRHGIHYAYEDRAWKVKKSFGHHQREIRSYAGYGYSHVVATAFEIGDNEWRIGNQTLQLRDWCRVVGVAGNREDKVKGMLAVEQDERTLSHIGMNFDRSLVRAKSRILGVAVAPDRPYLAYWTAGRGLELLYLETGHSRTLLEEQD
jgi:hypothetical protein